MKLVFLAGVLCIIVGSSWSARADDLDLAKQKFAEGIALFSSEQYEPALVSFDESYALAPRTTTLFNIGMCYKALRRHVEAIEAFERMLASDLETVETGMVGEARGAIDLLITLVGELKIEGAPPGSKIVLNGKEAAIAPVKQPILLDPGNYSLRVTKDGFAPFDDKVVVAAGAQNLVWAELDPSVSEGASTAVAPALEVDAASEKIDLDQSPFKSPLFTTGVVTGGVGVAGLVVGALFSIQFANHRDEGNGSRQDYIAANEADDSSAMAEHKSDYNDAEELLQRDRTAAAVGYLAGGTLLATGIVFVVVDRLRNKSDDGTKVAVIPTGSGVMLRF